jgi:hypothetical protein
MFKEVYELDDKGYIIDNYIAEFEDGEMITDFGEKVMITVSLPQPLYIIKPRFDGSKWVEGATQEEIDEATKVEPTPPSETEQTIELLKKQNQALSKMNAELSSKNAELKQSVILHDGIISELVLKVFSEDAEVV